MKKITIACFLLLLLTPAIYSQKKSPTIRVTREELDVLNMEAEETERGWTHIGDSVSAYVFYKRNGLVRYSNSIIKTWVKYRLRSDIDKQTGDLPSDTGYFLLLEMFDCRNRSTKALEEIFYRTDGTVINSRKFTKPSWNDVTPDSIGEIILRYICGVKRKT